MMQLIRKFYMIFDRFCRNTGFSSIFFLEKDSNCNYILLNKLDISNAVYCLVTLVKKVGKQENLPSLDIHIA